MRWTHEQYQRIEHILPKQRGNVVIDHFTFLQALQYMAENGCRWRALPEKFGKWSTIYGRFRYWIDGGVFDRIEKELQSQAIDIKGIKELALDSRISEIQPSKFTPTERVLRNGNDKWGLHPSAKVEAD